MSLQESINNQMKAAMLSKNTVALNTIRGLKAAISNAALNTGNIKTELSDSDIISVVRKQIKQRTDSISAFKNANRDDLVKKEELEISFLESFLPQALSDNEVDEIIKQAISETGASSRKQMGLVMKRATELCAGRVDSRVISTKVGIILDQNK